MENKHFEEFAHDCANKLASQIEAGRAPWDLGGTPSAYPVDAISGKPLQGITALQLMVREKTSGFEDNRWLTPSQIEVLAQLSRKEPEEFPASAGIREQKENPNLPRFLKPITTLSSVRILKGPFLNLCLLNISQKLNLKICAPCLAMPIKAIHGPAALVPLSMGATS